MRRITQKSSITGMIGHFEFDENDPFWVVYDGIGKSTSVTKKGDVINPDQYHLDQASAPKLAPWGCFFVSVRFNPEKTISLVARSSYTVAKLMMHIHLKEDVVPFKQSLFLAGQLLDDEDRALSDYNISGGCILDLVIAYRGIRKINVATFSGGEMLPLDVHARMTIKEVKDQIHAKKGIPVEQQKLLYHGQQLEDNKMPLHYDIIQDESPLHLVQTTG